MKNFIGTVLMAIILLAVAFVLVVMFVSPDVLKLPSQTIPPSNQAITTAIATYTPVWEPNEVATVIAIVKPTPYVTWSVTDYLGFKKGLAGKFALVASGKLIGADYSAINAEWYCTDLKLGDWSLPGSMIGNASVMEASWSIGANLNDITFDVVEATESKGKVETVFIDNGIDPPHYLKIPSATIIVNISELHVTQANIAYGNEQVFSVGDSNAFYKLLLITRDMVTGNSLLEQKRTEVVNLSLNRVKIETLMPGGSDKNLIALREKFILSLTTPGNAKEAHVYDKLMEILTPYAQSKGYSGVENIVVSLDNVYFSAKDWTDFEGNPLLPEDYPAMFAGSVCPNEHPTNLDLSNLGLPTIPGK